MVTETKLLKDDGREAEVCYVPDNGEIYAQGNCSHFIGSIIPSDANVAFIGDHLFGDICGPKKSTPWYNHLSLLHK